MKTKRVDLTAVAAGMESLGRNCEFGLVQRRAGVDPLGLLRFSESPLNGLTEAIRSRFAGLRDGLRFSVSRNGEWLSHWGGLTFHSDRQACDFSEEDARARESKRLPWLAEKLLMDIESAEKLFVYCDADTTGPSAAFPLLAELREMGDARLLVVVADSENAGTLDCSAWPLLVGRISRLSPTHHAADFDWTSWETLLAEVSDVTGTAWRQDNELPPGFDPETYLAINPDVAAAGMVASDHYRRFGWREGRRWKLP